MNYFSQILFLLILGGAGFLIWKSVSRIRKNILLGKDDYRYDRIPERFRNMSLMALGQKKMFHKPIPAILHLFVYLGFLIVNIEMLEIVIDGLFGTHRSLHPVLGSLYPYVINIFEFFAVSVIVACAIFLVRRNIIHVRRFESQEMTRWPKLDANIILTFEILLMTAFLSMNAADTVLQTKGAAGYHHTGSFAFSNLLAGLFTNLPENALMIIERSAWWIHIIGVLTFSVYIFQDSKHLHIFLAFPNTFFGKLDPVGKWDNMPAVTKEVKLMLNLPLSEQEQQFQHSGKFGAKDVTDLTWKNLLDAYSCTECGRCTAACPANITGKKLSPRKIMMDTRDRLEEVGRNIEKHGKDHNDGKSLLGNYISEEEIMACTTCNACVEACPVLIEPLDIIVQLRRFKIMEESQAPASWNSMFSNIENNFAPWKFSPSDRFNWAEKINK
jgi:heterodisulfide reductase subunit C